MLRSRWWTVVGVSWAVTIVLGVALAWTVLASHGPERSEPVILKGIDRTVVYHGVASTYLTVLPAEGCSLCPVTIEAGTTITFLLGSWWANATPLPGGGVWVNWSLVSPFPFEKLVSGEPPAPLVYNETGSDWLQGGGVESYLSVVIPYHYSNLPSEGNITLAVNATES
jgi:hypothetical protein